MSALEWLLHQQPTTPGRSKAEIDADLAEERNWGSDFSTPVRCIPDALPPSCCLHLGPEALIVSGEAAFARVPSLALLLVEGSPPEAQIDIESLHRMKRLGGWVGRHLDLTAARLAPVPLESAPLAALLHQSQEHLLEQLNALEAQLAKEAMAALLGRESLGTAAIEGEQHLVLAMHHGCHNRRRSADRIRRRG